MSNADIFFRLKKGDLRTVRRVLRWAHPRSLRIDVDVLDCAKSWARQRADLSFDDVVNLMTRDSIGFFCIILRRRMHGYNFLDTPADSDILEIGVRNIHKDSPRFSPEYFIFMYLPCESLEDLKKVFDILPVN